VAVEPTCWLAAASGAAVAAFYKSANYQAKNAMKMFIRYFTNTEND